MGGFNQNTNTNNGLFGVGSGGNNVNNNPQSGGGLFGNSNNNSNNGLFGNSNSNNR